MNTDKMIDITGVNLQQFVCEVYAMSRPVGMGMLHYQDGPLSDQNAKFILDQGNSNYAVRMDYVCGRQCKMTVYRQDGKLWINRQWYDHTDQQLAELLTRCGMEHKIAEIGK